MNLVRAGHLHTPAETAPLFAEPGDCSTATVAWVNEKTDDAPESVNLGVLDHEGLRIHGFTNIVVAAPKARDTADDEDEGRTFHLSADCPWKR